MATKLLPVTFLNNAKAPTATLLLPVVLKLSALLPFAVLLLPVVLLNSAFLPVAALLLPVVLLFNARLPVAVLSEPVVLLRSTWVIKETIKKDLPEGFQRSEFILEHGFLDFIVPRKELKEKLGTVLTLLKN